MKIQIEMAIYELVGDIEILKIISRETKCNMANEKLFDLEQEANIWIK